MRFVGPSYSLQHRKADVQRVVNLMPVVNEVPGGTTVSYLEQVPGLAIFSLAYLEGSIYLLLENGNYVLQEKGGRIRIDEIVYVLMAEDGTTLLTEDYSRILQE
jgi:hypothetical protein